MAGERWGRAAFPGIQQVQACEYTVSHGTMLGTAVLTIAPQASFPALGGDLVIFDGTGSVTIRDCKVLEHTFQRNASGLIWQLSIVDRRWKWEFGQISGNYNLRNGNNGLVERTAKTPRELAVLCLDAMGEVNFNVDGLPEDVIARPYINWASDPPMRMLEDLAELYGCRVVYDPVSDAVTIRKAGEGAALPDGPIVDNSLTIDPPERPDVIRVVCAPTRWNTWLYLEAVGLDRDGKIKPIDELSYAPPGPDALPGDTRWRNATPPRYGGIPSDADRALAQESVFRWYRITVKNPATPSEDNARLVIPGVGPIFHRGQLLPLEEYQADTAVDPPAPPNAPPNEVLSQHTPIEPLIRGNFYNGGTNATNTENEIYQSPYSIDRENGIIKFGWYTYFFVAPDNTLAPADLYILLGVTVRDFATNAFLCYERDFVFGPPQFNTKPKVIRKDEHHLTVLPVFNEDFSLVPQANDFQVDTNADELNPLLDQYLLGAAKEYQQPLPQTITYAGIYPFQLDGAIQQITWQVGGSQPCITRVSRNSEHKTFLLNHKERRRLLNRDGSSGRSPLVATFGKNDPALSSATSSALATRG